MKPPRVWAILGGLPAEKEEQVAAFGMHIGTAFQLIDDVPDYSGDEADTGKHIGDDLAEGKPTLPLIHVMKHGSPNTRPVCAAPSRTAAVTISRRCSPPSVPAARSRPPAVAQEAELALDALKRCPFRFKDSW